MTASISRFKKKTLIFGGFCCYAAQLCDGAAQACLSRILRAFFCTRPVQTGLFLYSLFYVLHTQLEKAKMNQGLVLCSQY